MTDQGAVPEESPLSTEGTPLRAHLLEERIARLEDAIASLQDTRQLEERVAQRLSIQLGTRKLATATLIEDAVVEPRRAILAPARTVNGPVVSVPRSFSWRQPWMLLEALGEVRDMVRMYLDRRYRVSWLAKVVPAAGLAAMFLSWLFFSGTWFGVGTIIDKSFDVLVVVVVYGLLLREVRGYRLTVADSGEMTQFPTLPAVGVQKRA
jgi:hypothetical protein